MLLYQICRMNYQSKPVSAYIMSRVITTTAYPHTNKKAIFSGCFYLPSDRPFRNLCAADEPRIRCQFSRSKTASDVKKSAWSAFVNICDIQPQEHLKRIHKRPRELTPKCCEIINRWPKRFRNYTPYVHAYILYFLIGLVTWRK